MTTGPTSPTVRAWQDWIHRQQAPLLVPWGRFDQSFQVDEAEAYLRDVPHAEVHVPDAGHFALDEKPATVGAPDPEVPLIGRRVVGPAPGTPCPESRMSLGASDTATADSALAGSPAAGGQ